MSNTTNPLPLDVADRTSATFFTQRIDSNYGWVNLSSYKTIAANFTITVQGRMFPTDAWVDILVVTQADFSATLLVNSAYGYHIDLMPQMQIVVSLSNAANFTQGWITEF